MVWQQRYKSLTNGLAVVLHPFFLAYMVMAQEFWRIGSGILLAISAAMCLLIPYIAVKKWAGDIYLKSRSKRIIPLSLSLFGYIILDIAVISLTEDVKVWMICGLITSLLLGITLLTFFIKVSMHTTAFGAILTYQVALVTKHSHWEQVLFLIFISILFLIVTMQRLHSNAHSLAEIVAGYVCGIIPVLLFLYLCFKMHYNL